MSLAKNISVAKSFNQELLNVDFWKSTEKIKKYSYTILNYFGKTESTIKLEISFDFYDAWVSTLPYDKSVYKISLPKIQTFFTDEKEKIRQIIGRGILLRHELSHIIFSDLIWMNNATSEFKIFCNFIDDARIEYLFGKTFNGAKAPFKKLAGIFYEQQKGKIETEFSVINFSCYLNYKIRGFSFNNTSLVQLYNSVINNNINVFKTEDIDLFKSAVEKAYKDIISKKEELLSDPNTNVVNEVPLNIPQSDEENNMEQDNDDTTEVGQKSQEQEEDLSNNSNDTKMGKSNDDTKPEKTSKEKEEGPSSKEEDNTDKEKKKELSKTKKDNDENDDPKDDDSEDEDFEDEKTQEDDFFDSLKEKVKKDNATTEDLFSYFDKDFVNIDIDSLLNYDFNVNDFSSSPILNLEKISKVMAGGVLRGKEKNGLQTYRVIVQANKKIINESVKYLKLKLQNRVINKKITFLTEGKIDQNNLKEIVLTKDVPRAFYQVINKITTGATINLLIDISTSMNVEDVKRAIVNAIIFTEISDALNIELNVYLFTSISSTLRIKPDAQIEYTKRVLNQSGVDYELQWSDTRKVAYIKVTNSSNNAILYSLKDKNEKITINLKKNLGILFDNARNLRSRFGGSTPEFQSMVTIYKQNINNNKRNIVFLINDGGYDKSFLDKINIKDNNVGIRTEYTEEGSKVNINKIIGQIHLKIKTIKELIENDEFNENFMRNVIKDFEIKKQTNSILLQKEKTQINEQLTEYIDCLKKLIEAFNKYDKYQIFNNERYIHSKLNASVFTSDIYYILSAIDNQISFDGFRIDIVDGNDKIVVKTNLHLNKNSSRISTTINNYFTYHFNSYDTIYRKFISFARNNKWDIFGIGINSSIGQKYIGHDNFMMFKHNEDIAKTFATKLREIF